MNNIYINKKQLSTLNISLMSLTRDTDVYNYAIEKGIFEEGEIDMYIETLGRMVGVMGNEEGALLVTEIDMDNVETCVDLWGHSIGGFDL